MTNLFLAFFCMLPWGNFLFRQVDIWHATGQFVQVGILILFCYSFFEKPKYMDITNKPLGSFVLWAGLVTAYRWISIFSATQHYPIKVFFPFFNLLCLILLYKLIVEYLDRNGINKILKWLKYSVILLLFYCTLQYLKLDEFFTGLLGKDELVGTMGNPMHLAGLLAILQPLFFEKSRENILSIILLWLVIIVTGSATGLVAGIAIVLFWLFFKKRLVCIIASALFIVSSIVLYFTNPLVNIFFFNSSRFEVWQRAFGLIRDNIITGLGLGTFAIAGIKRGGIHWQHLHNDYFQVVFELGLVGLVLVVWCVTDYFKKFYVARDNLTIRLASMFFGFCLLCGVTFFSHLWITSVIGLFSFASIYCIKNTEERCGQDLRFTQG